MIISTRNVLLLIAIVVFVLATFSVPTHIAWLNLTAFGLACLAGALLVWPGGHV